MRNEKEILAEAVNSLYKYTNIEAEIEDGRLRYDAYLNIAGERFVVEIKSEVTKGNRGIVLRDLKNIRTEKFFSPSTISFRLKELIQCGAVSRQIAVSSGRNVVAYKITETGKQSLELADKFESELRMILKE